MNASSSVTTPQAPAASSLRTAIPGYLGDPARPRFAWLHRPSAPASVGMVIVPPFGFESVCAHRTMRHLAESAANAGIAAVRIDLDGSGDSAGSDHDDERWSAWLSSIDDACALLLAQGARRLVLVGIRLGAALATQAALRRGDIDGLVAIAAVVSGKAYLREARVLQMAMDLAPAPTPVADDGTQEIAGFTITAGTRSSIAAVDLLAATACPARAILVIDRDDLPAHDALVEKFRACGARVEHQRLPGYPEMMLEPHRTEIPEAIIQASVAFAGRIDDPAAADRPVPADPGIAFARSAHFDAIEGAIEERPVELDPHLFGIATRPRTGTPSRAVLLLNAGAIGRIGPNRMHVGLARRIASAGSLALRLDLSGMGDSTPRAGAEENVVYSEHAIADVGIAVDWAREQGAEEVVVLGLCSGAYHAYKAAEAGQEIDRLLLINPLTFNYTPGMSLDSAAFHVTAQSQLYKASLRKASSWKKLLSGGVRIGPIVRVLLRRVGMLAEHHVRNLLRSSGVRMQDDLGTNLMALAQRGVAMRFVFSASDPGRKLLLEQGGSVVGSLMDQGALEMQVIEGADHTFTPLWSQLILIDTLLRAIPGLVEM